MGAALRMNERGVAGPVRSLDLDVGFDDLNSRRARPGCSGHPRGQRESYKVAPPDVAGPRISLLLVVLVFHHDPPSKSVSLSWRAPDCKPVVPWAFVARPSGCRVET